MQDEEAPAATAPRQVTVEYADLLDEKADLERRLKVVSAKLGERQAGIMAWFEQQGVTSVRVAGGRTLYLRRELWAVKEDGVSTERAVLALKEAGLDEFAKPGVNTQGLSAYLRELDRDQKPLPGPLVGVIRAAETFKVGSTSNGSTRRASEPGQGDSDR